MATQVAGAYARLRLLDDQRREAEQRVELERQLERLQRVELMGVQAAGVAHDLNNYLMVVHGALQMLEHGHGSSAADLADAMQATEKSIQVVRQLLALGRPAQRHEGEFELGAKLRDSLHLLRPVIPRSIELVTLREEPARVFADSVQVEQAIANLVLNARDAIASAGRIEVAVDTVTLGPDELRPHPAAQPGRYARMLVRDTGRGISPEHLHRIFEPLFTTKEKGTGLGLAVVARVAQQHHGLVACESTVGQGTTFRFMLPLAGA
ncbi:MAG: ATP-binding protein [Myxococcaceae bacterium]